LAMVVPPRGTFLLPAPLPSQGSGKLQLIPQIHFTITSPGKPSQLFCLASLRSFPGRDHYVLLASSSEHTHSETEAQVVQLKRTAFKKKCKTGSHSPGWNPLCRQCWLVTLDLSASTS
jgi:hypothetical protein